MELIRYRRVTAMRTRAIKISLTESEYQLVTLKSLETGVTVAELARQILMRGVEVNPVKEDWAALLQKYPELYTMWLKLLNLEGRMIEMEDNRGSGR